MLKETQRHYVLCVPYQHLSRLVSHISLHRKVPSSDSPNYDIILMSEILFIVGGIRLFYFVREMSSPDLYASANSTKATAFILSIVLSEYPNFSPI